MTPWLDDGDVQLHHGDVIQTLRELPAGIAQTCVTSPPYWGLRDYGTGEWSGGDTACDHLAPPGGGTQATGLQRDGRSEEARNGNAARIVEDRRQQYRDVCGRCGARRVDSQLGLEATPDLYVERLVAVFREVWRVLADSGTLWLNLGSSFASATCTCDAPTRPQTVLDPFIGSGTTALVARNHGRRCIGIDLALPYLEIAARRLQQLSLFGGAA